MRRNVLSCCSCASKNFCSIYWNKSAYQWTHTVQALVVQGSAVLSVLSQFFLECLLFPRVCIVVRVCLAVPLVWGFTYSHSVSWVVSCPHSNTHLYPLSSTPTLAADWSPGLSPWGCSREIPNAFPRGRESLLLCIFFMMGPWFPVSSVFLVYSFIVVGGHPLLVLRRRNER